MKALQFIHIFKNYFSFFKRPDFLLFCIVSGFSYGVLFSYLGLSSFFIIEQMHYSLINFGLIVATNAIAIIFMAIVIPKIANRFSFVQITQFGLTLILSGGLVMWLLNSYISKDIYTFMLPIFMVTLGIGAIRPTASAGAMQLVKSNVAGSAASFFSIFSFVSGTIAINLTTKLIHHVSSFGLFMTCMGISALLIFNLFSYRIQVKNAKM